MNRLLLPLFALPLFACSAPSASVGVHVGQYALDGDVGLATAAAGGAEPADAAGGLACPGRTGTRLAVCGGAAPVA